MALDVMDAVLYPQALVTTSKSLGSWLHEL